MLKILVTCFLSLIFVGLGDAGSTRLATICEIQKNPDKYSGEFVKVRAWVALDWESFEAWDEKCRGGAITLAYPSDPNVQPHPDFALQKDKQYELFKELVTAKDYPPKSTKPGAIDSSNDPTLALPRYKVGATIVGRLDSDCIRDKDGRLISATSLEPTAHCHLRLVIRAVSDVTSQPWNSENRIPSQ